MIVCLVRIELRLYEVRSLKDKRSIVKGLIERIRSRFKVSAAEVGEQDVWQNAQLGLALVGSAKTLLERELEKILVVIDQEEEAEIISVQREIWNYPGTD